jgi:tetratricopeptide (TPR) repeat protein
MSAPQELRSEALALRDAQQMEQAYAAITRASAIAPTDAGIAFIHAQIALETGRPAAALFGKAQTMDRENLVLARNHAAAIADEGRTADAIAFLEERLRTQPGWLDGHKLRANLALATGDEDFGSSYAAACRIEPDNIGLRLAWFQLLAHARDWDGAGDVIAGAIARTGQRPAFDYAKIYIASESGDSENPALFDGIGDVRDPGLDLCQVRFWLRNGDAGRAEAIAARNMNTPSAAMFWPYLSLAWRMTGNPKARWLDRPDELIRTYDLPLNADALLILGQCLRGLHNRSSHFLEQSVRGGTQTQGQLFFQHHPAIQHVRAMAANAVEDYIRSLPPHDPAHPLLAYSRPGKEEILFEGSWSVRLGAQGFHRRHTHVNGWISSALYIAMPAAADMGDPPAGWLEFGGGPPELKTNVPAYEYAEPLPARLVLFPSYLWHGTVPFSDGERLTIAFDVRRPHLQSPA